jgi:hypothetical protein
MKAHALWLLFLVAGCATTISDVDTSNKEPECAHSCSNNYNDCIKAFTLMPIRLQRECAAALHQCAQACPDKKADAALSGPVPGPPTVQRDQPRSKEDRLRELKRLHDAGLINDDVYSDRQKAILSEP